MIRRGAGCGTWGPESSAPHPGHFTPGGMAEHKAWEVSSTLLVSVWGGTSALMLWTPQPWACFLSSPLSPSRLRNQEAPGSHQVQTQGERGGKGPAVPACLELPQSLSSFGDAHGFGRVNVWWTRQEALLPCLHPRDLGASTGRALWWCWRTTIGLLPERKPGGL